VLGAALWTARDRDARWWAALRDRYADHYARATDPARVEPRYAPPVPVAARTATVVPREGDAPALRLEAVEEGAVAVPVAVVSAAPVPGLVDGGGVGGGEMERGKAWKGWFWRS